MTKTHKAASTRPQTQAEDLDLAISTTDAAISAYLRPGMVYNKV